MRTTSVEVYRRIESEGLLKGKRFEVYATLYKHGPCTAAEIAERLPGHKLASVGCNVHARLCELRFMNAVIELGERTCGITGNNVILWDVTDAIPRPYESNLRETRREEVARLTCRLNEALSCLSIGIRIHGASPSNAEKAWTRRAQILLDNEWS